MQHLGRPAIAAWGIVPLLLVVAATLYAPLTQKYGWTYPALFSSDYPVKLDLEEIALLTSQRDRARTDGALHRMVQEPAPGTALLMEVSALPVPDELQAGGSEPQLSPATDGGSEPQSGNGNVRGGVLAIDFNLAGDANRAGMLQLSKTVQFEQQSLGQLAIRIDDASRIFVSRDDLLRVIPDALRPPGTLAGDFIPLQQLRDSGVNLRYDPLRDHFVLTE